MIPTVYMNVAVKYVKGTATNEKREVRVISVDWKRHTMEIEYDTDMHGDGIMRSWSCLVSYDPFIQKYMATMLK